MTNTTAASCEHVIVVRTAKIGACVPGVESSCVYVCAEGAPGIICGTEGSSRGTGTESHVGNRLSAKPSVIATLEDIRRG